VGMPTRRVPHNLDNVTVSIKDFSFLNLDIIIHNGAQKGKQHAQGDQANHVNREYTKRSLASSSLPRKYMYIITQGPLSLKIKHLEWVNPVERDCVRK
jgi:hypothetical protein